MVTRGQTLGYALRNQRWRYGKWPDGEELYNLTNDPQEKRNLAELPHLKERLQEFRQILDGVQKRATAESKSSKNKAAAPKPIGQTGSDGAMAGRRTVEPV